MSLSNEQWEFLQDICKLVAYAKSKGYKLTGGELYRPMSMQYLYFFGFKVLRWASGALPLGLAIAPKLSKTLDSMHLQRLAMDFNIFFDVDDDGIKDYIDTAEEYQFIGTDLGDFWLSLNKKNTCGFAWGWDQGHFERRV